MRGRLERQTWTYDPTLYAPARYRRACAYEAFIPDPVAGFGDPLPAALAGVVSDAEHAVRVLNDRARPALEPLARLLLRTEAIASSKVEGLQVDARNLARAEANADAGRRPGTVAAEILANIDAMELSIDETSAAGELGSGHLQDIHRALMRNSPTPRIAGRLRETQNWIGGNDHNPCGADFVPPPPAEIDGLLADLCRMAVEEDLPPIIQAAIVHAQFETIHPFEDGNGRTGRALIHVVLRRRGLAPRYVPPMSVVLAAGKDHYIQGLTRFRDGDVEGWIEQFAVAAATSAALAERYLAGVAETQERWREMVREQGGLRSDAAAWSIIDALPGHPVITAPVATAVIKRSKSSTAVAIDQLVDAGVLIPLSTSKRNRAWEADGLLDLLADIDSR